MMFDHGRIHISLHKPIKFQLRPDAVLQESTMKKIVNTFKSPNVDVRIIQQRGWFSWTVQEKWLAVVGLGVGEQVVQWYYDDGCCSDAYGDLHQITFVADEEHASGECILVHSSGFYRGAVAVGNRAISSEFYNRGRDDGGLSKEFLFFSEAFRLIDKMYDPARPNPSLCENFRYLARISTTGRIDWSELYELFPEDWDVSQSSYYHAIQRIVMIMRQAMDQGQILQSELRNLIKHAEAIVVERKRKHLERTYGDEFNRRMCELYDQFGRSSVVSFVHRQFLDLPEPSEEPSPGETLSNNYVGVWESTVHRLTAIANLPELSIDDLALM